MIDILLRASARFKVQRKLRLYGGFTRQLHQIVYCYWVYRRQESGYRNYEYATYEGNDVFAMVKIKEFFSAADSAGMRSFHKERNPWCNGFKVLCYCSCSFVLKLADDDAAAMLIYQRMTLRTVQYTKVSCILLEMYFSGQCSGQTLVQLQ